MKRTILFVLVAFTLSACATGKAVQMQNKNRDIVECRAAAGFGAKAKAEKEKFDKCVKDYEAKGYKVFDSNFQMLKH